ncbi:MAG TPA: DHH family phosphoesterase, partial [Chitinophagaceae bacterium]|nr:DHH family phosphoesterase [Chitinophagaceae bacterium]
MKNLTELVDILATPQKIAITYHHNPDADALGSSLGLCQYLQSKGHQCQVISPNSIPDFLMWMPQSASVLIYEDSKTEVEKILDDSTVLFSLDYNQYSRTHALGPALSAFVGTTVLIDHHLFPDPDFEFGLSLPSKSSTCEMVYDFINLNDDNMLITTDIAKCLYAGAMTDTGSFKFSCTTAGVHLMVADF